MKRDNVTGDLLSGIPTPVAARPASLDFRSAVAHVLCRMLSVAQARDPGLDRYGIAATASRFAGKEISKAMLDAYTAESRDAYNLPFWAAPAIEVACDSTALTEWLAEVRGGRLVLGPATIDAEIGRLQVEREAMSDRLRDLRALRRSIR